MKKIFILCAFIFFAISSGCSSEENVAENVSPEVDPIEEELKNLSLEEKIGQMMLIGVHGKNIDENINYMLDTYKVGGIIFFDRNLESKDQVKNFVDALQKNRKIPLFIAIDEEGGRVARMKSFVTPPPSQELIGKSGDFSLAKTHAKEIAKKLGELGINLNFAPVADVGNYDRSFSGDAEIVAEFVSNAAKGYEEENFFYTLKHFPGIGKAKVDPHQDVSEIEISKQNLLAEDVVPFKKIIDEQNNSKFMIMIGQLKYPALDKNNPATLSSAIITNLLREELNFQGVIISDDLEMGSTSNYNNFENLGVQAVKAGADIVLVCHEYEHEKKACDGILDAVQSGEISVERIDDSVRRILKMKNSLRN